MNESTATSTFPRRSFGETMRADVWWTQPLLVFVGLSIFIIYSTWAAFQGKNYFVGNYISPFYSLEFFGNWLTGCFDRKLPWWPAWLLFPPRLLFPWPLPDFRSTCNNYPGANSKPFWANPPAGTVAEPRKSNWVKRSFPPIVQTVHRN